ncbi:MAG: hypothetical protein WC799_15030 [Desulfobacteraceae bacterium]|jgi:hypothetical protein
MKKLTILINILFLATSLTCSSVYALETLSAAQMKNAVAQAGVDIAITDAVTEIHENHITFSSPDQDETTCYLTLNNLHLISSLNTGKSDENDNGFLNHLSLDVGINPATNQVMLFADSPDLSIVTDLTVDNIDFCGENIGKINVNDFTLSSFHLYAGPHVNQTGIDFETGQRTTIETMTYQYGNTEDLSLILSGVCLASSFNGTTAIGEFKVGDLSSGKQASININYDISENRSFLALNLPMEGSLHIENITFGGNDLGALTLDGIHAEKLYIELPGRGLGRP